MSTRSLSRAALPALPAGIPTPAYLDGSPRIGIVHIGVGNFHRSHQAMYLDRLLSADPDAPWAVCGIGVMPGDQTLARTLNAQDGLYSLSLFHPDGRVDTRVIGALREFVLAGDDPAGAIGRLVDPAVRIVSLTITESGYVEDPTNDRRASENAGIRSDVEKGLVAPHTAFGLIVAALRARRAAGVAPFTVLSCDNIQRNGTIARASVLATARLVDEELAVWIEEHVGFPNTMVDRITPRPTADQLAVVELALGLRDGAVVVAEPFEQWILEDDFRSGRPALESVGAVFTDDIDAYESMKLRLLNGAHQVLAYTGILRGHRFAHEAMQDPVVRTWLDRYWHELALPPLELPAGVDAEEYIRVLVERFGNVAIADTLERLAADSSDRMAKFVLPVLTDAREEPGFPGIAAVVLASWAIAVTTSTSPVILSGVPEEAFTAMRSGGDSGAFLTKLAWMAPLADDARLRDGVASAMRMLRSADPAQALERLSTRP